jgi:hypothetical protein
MGDALDPEKLRFTIMPEPRPGDIRSVQAYQQGKMLQNGGWHGILPRNITPSDIDLVFDDRNHGRIMFCEVSRKSHWSECDYGQRTLYEALVRLGARRVFCALLTHNVSPVKNIDTTKDIVSYNLMFYLNGNIGLSDVLAGGEKWVDLVNRFYSGEDFYRWLKEPLTVWVNP